MPGYGEVGLEPLLAEGDAVLGQIPGDNQQETVKSIEIGDLSMWANDKTVNPGQQPERLQKTNRTPVRSFTTPWVMLPAGMREPLIHGVRDGKIVVGPADLSLFYVNLAIVGPVSKKSHCYFPLRPGKANRIYQAALDLAELLKQEGW